MSHGPEAGKEGGHGHEEESVLGHIWNSIKNISKAVSLSVSKVLGGFGRLVRHKKKPHLQVLPGGKDEGKGKGKDEEATKPNLVADKGGGKKAAKEAKDDDATVAAVSAAVSSDHHGAASGH